MYLATSGAGMGRDDDASVARTYAALSGAVLPSVTAPNSTKAG
jgi:3-hydroxyisobutyrate dehydrogenase